MSSSEESILKLLKKGEEELLQKRHKLLRKQIKDTGDNLRNYNSWDYLHQFRLEVDEILKNEVLSAQFDEKTLHIFRKIQEYIPNVGSCEYGYGVRDEEEMSKPCIRYGDMYTDFLTVLEEKLSEVRVSFVSDLKEAEEKLKILDAQKNTFVINLVNELNDTLLLKLNLPDDKELFTEQTLVNALVKRLKEGSDREVNKAMIQRRIDEILQQGSRHHISLLLTELGVRSKVGQTLDLMIKLQKSLISSRDERVKALAQAKENLDTLDKFIDTIYRNHNKALKATAEAVDHLVTTVNSNDLEHAITAYLSKDEHAINDTTPQEQGSGWGRLTAMVSSDFKPQMTTSLASVRTYAHSSFLDATEIRFGTQGQRHKGKERVSPLFELWLDVQQRRHVEKYKEEHNGAEPKGVDAITHVYFNNLGVDRDDWEGKKERRLSEVLHRLEDNHPNVAVISIPADKGIMSKTMLSKEGTVTGKRAKEMLLAIATRNKDGAKLPEIEDDKKDFYISDNIKYLLGRDEDGGYDALVKRLVKESFKELGFKPADNLSYSELQGVFFHFSKFKLTNHIIDTLKPETFNMSCKDAIDRGGVSSAYYNLMKSIEIGHPMTKAEFNEALHSAPTLVKGRGMNHHAKIIWNTIDVYLQNPENLEKTPKWLSDWRFENCPKDKAKESLDKTIVGSLKRLQIILVRQQETPETGETKINIEILQKAIKMLKETQSLSQEATKSSAYSMVYQTALQTESLVNKAIAFNENPSDAPTRESFVKASERYENLQHKADKHYSKLGKVIGQFFNWLFNSQSFNNNITVKALVESYGKMKEHLDKVNEAHKDGFLAFSH